MVRDVRSIVVYVTRRNSQNHNGSIRPIADIRDLPKTQQMNTKSWLNDIILVKDGVDLAPSALDVFRSEGDACSYLEHWWVDDLHGLAFTAVGAQAIFGVDNARVIVDRLEFRSDGEEIVLSWLRHTANEHFEARRARAAKRKLYLGTEESQGVLPTSVEGLIAYIGFTS